MDACEEDGENFLTLLFERRPELVELLSGTSEVPDPVAKQGGAKRVHKSAISFSTLLDGSGQRASSSPCGPRKLSLKARIEGLPWVRPDGCQQPGGPSALATVGVSEDGGVEPAEGGSAGDAGLYSSAGSDGHTQRQGNVPTAEVPANHSATAAAAASSAAVDVQSAAAASMASAAAKDRQQQGLLGSAPSFCGSCDSAGVSHSTTTTHSGAGGSLAGSITGQDPEHDPAEGSKGSEEPDATGPFGAALSIAVTVAATSSAVSSLSLEASFRPPTPLSPSGRMSPNGRCLRSRGRAVSPVPSLVMQLNGTRVSARSAATAGTGARAAPCASEPGEGTYIQPVRGGTPALCGPPPVPCSSPEPATPSKKASLQPILLLPPLPPAPPPRQMVSVRSLPVLQLQQQQQQPAAQQEQGPGLLQQPQQQQQRLLQQAPPRVPDPLCLDMIVGVGLQSSVGGADGAALADVSQQGDMPAEGPVLVEVTPWSREVDDDLDTLLGAPLPPPLPDSSRTAQLSAQLHQLQQLHRRLHRTMSSPEPSLTSPEALCDVPARTSVSSPSRLPPHNRSLPQLGDIMVGMAVTADGSTGSGDVTLLARAHTVAGTPMEARLTPRSLGPLRGTPRGTPPRRAATAHVPGRDGAADARPSGDGASGGGNSAVRPGVGGGALTGSGGRRASSDGEAANDGVRGGEGPRRPHGARDAGGAAAGAVPAIATQTLTLPVRRPSQHLSPLGAMPSRGTHRGGIAPLLAFINQRQGQPPTRGSRHSLHEGLLHAARVGGADGDGGPIGASGIGGRKSAPIEVDRSTVEEVLLSARRHSQTYDTDAPVPMNGALPSCGRPSLTNPRATHGASASGEARLGAPGHGPSVATPAAAPPALPALAYTGGHRATGVKFSPRHSVRGQALNPIRHEPRASRQGGTSPPQCTSPEHPGRTDTQGGRRAASPGPMEPHVAPAAHAAAAAAPAGAAHAHELSMPVAVVRPLRLGTRSPAPAHPLQHPSPTLKGGRSPRPGNSSPRSASPGLLPSINVPAGGSTPSRKGSLATAHAAAATSSSKAA